VDAGTVAPNATLNPVNAAVSVKREDDFAAIQAILQTIHWQVPGQYEVNLPDNLIQATVYWSTDESDGVATEYPLTATASAGGIVFPPVTSSADASASVSGALAFKLKRGYNGPVSAKFHVFFLPIASVTQSAILTKLGATTWPVVRSVTEQVVVSTTGKSLRRSETTQATQSLGSGGVPGTFGSQTVSDSVSRRGSIDQRVFDVPYSLHGVIPIGSSGASTVTSSATVKGTASTVTATGSLSVSSLAATTPPQFPTGVFAVKTSVEPYDFEMVRVSAITVELTSAHVS
jgi:hypothetical protein